MALAASGAMCYNELAEAEGMAHLLKYDSSHGRFDWDVRQERDVLYVGDDAIRLLHQKELSLLPWGELGVDVVLDCTGVYGKRSDGELHLSAGAKKVLFSHPGGADLDATVIYGVNHQQLQAEHRLVSNGSCTTNCIIPIIKLLDDTFNIESGTVTTIHASMNDQQVIDAYHPDLRRTRAASQSIIPVDTKLAAGITRIFPKFCDRFEAISVRVPTINVTAIDLSVTVTQPVNVLDVNNVLQRAAKGSFRSIVDYTELPLVSIDFNHESGVITNGVLPTVCWIPRWRWLSVVLITSSNKWETTALIAGRGFMLLREIRHQSR